MSLLRPRILIVSHGLRLGGVERSLIGLLRALPRDATQIDLLLLEHKGELLDQVPLHVNTLPSVPAYAALMMPLRQVLASRYFFVGLARIAARVVVALRRTVGLSPGFLPARSHRYASWFLPKVKNAYDLAISFLMPHDLVCQKVDARRKAGWIHTDYTSVEYGVAAAFEVKAWREMDQIISISSEVAIATLKVFPELAGKIVVIENLLDPEWVRQRSVHYSPADLVDWPAAPTLSFCSVGRLTHQKGFDIAIMAANKVRAAGLKFRWFVIGYGPDEPLLRRLIAEHGLEDCFILVGALENPYPFIRACDLYIQPSRYEGKAVAIREAQMLGKAILVSDFATVRSQISDGEDGYITPAGVDGLCEGIFRLSRDPALRTKLANTAASRDYGNLGEVDKVLALVPKQ